MTVLVVTGTDTGVGKTIATAALACHARLAGLDVAVCKPVQTGSADGDDDLAEVARLSGVGELVSGWRYPEPLAPVAAAQRAAMALPTRAELVALIRGMDEPGRLTVVEGAGGLLVELGAEGVTLRDLARGSECARAGGRQARVGHLEPRGADIGSACITRCFVRRPGDRRMARRAGCRRGGQSRSAWRAGPAASRAACGRRILSAADFAAVSEVAFDPGWVRGLV